jgi:transcriptional regulator with XRE-family HTH domain
MNYKEELRKIEKTKTLAERQDLHYVTLKISKMVKLARIDKGLTQEELAKKIGTKQPSLARLEAARTSPSISFLNEIAKALDTYLVEPRFKSVEHFYMNEYANIRKRPSNTKSVTRLVLSNTQENSVRCKATYLGQQALNYNS